MSKTVPNGPDVIVLVDKPQGVTSHDVVATSRKVFGTRRVGHAGTLDPMATGLLLLGVNKATRLLTYLVGETKTYETTIRLGESTNTDDAEGEITAQATQAEIDHVHNDDIAAVISAQLTGDIMQRPSAVSAVKINGQRAYKRVRAGEDVEIPAREVTIYDFSVSSVTRDDSYIDVVATVTCSSGTYIRALARDLGSALGIGGHLIALRRTKIGPFDVADAAALTKQSQVPVGAALLTMAQAARSVFKTYPISAEQTLALRQGKRLAALGDTTGRFALICDENLVAIAYDGTRHLVTECVFPGSGPSGTGVEPK